MGWVIFWWFDGVELGRSIWGVGIGYGISGEFVHLADVLILYGLRVYVGLYVGMDGLWVLWMAC